MRILTVLILLLAMFMFTAHLTYIRSFAEAREQIASPKEETQVTIEALRNKIDAIDQEILRLINERAEAAVEIGKLKEKEGLSVYNPEREKIIEEKLKRDNPGPLPDSSIIKIYKEIIAACRSIQY